MKVDLLISLGQLILTGLGQGLAYTSCYIIIGQYFDKRKAVAMGLASFSSGVGALACPPLILLLFQQYGFTGMFLILGACSLHICAAGALFRPLKVSTRVLTTITIEHAEVALPESMRNCETEPGDEDTLLKKDQRTTEMEKTTLKMDNTEEDTSQCDIESKGLDVDDTPGPNRTFKERYVLLFRCPPFLALVFVVFTLGYSLGLMSGFLPAIAVENGVDEANAAFLLSMR